MDDYVPKSPDFSALSSYGNTQTQHYQAPSSYGLQPKRQDSFSLPPSQYHPPIATRPTPTLGTSHFRNQQSPIKQEYLPDDWLDRPTSNVVDSTIAPAVLPKVAKKGKGKQDVKSESEPRPPAPGDEEGIQIRTKFPTARIKRIVQADEEVGKVAQVTPPVVGKALELFMIQMTLAAAAGAAKSGSKRLTAAHIKAAILNDDKFDFLKDIGDKIPDAPATRNEHKERKAKAEKGLSDDEMDGVSGGPKGARRKAIGKRKASGEED